MFSSPQCYAPSLLAVIWHCTQWHPLPTTRILCSRRGLPAGRSVQAKVISASSVGFRLIEQFVKQHMRQISHLDSPSTTRHAMLCSSMTPECHASYTLGPTASPSACDINAANASNQDPVLLGIPKHHRTLSRLQ